MTNGNKQQLVDALLSKGKHDAAVRVALLVSIENNNNVYLPNAYDMVKTALTKHQFAGHLAAATKAGFYVPSSDAESAGFWGSIK